MPIFRLEGPFADPEAEKICATELSSVIWQRPLFMNTLFVLNGLFFATVNSFVSFLENPRKALAMVIYGPSPHQSEPRACCTRLQCLSPLSPVPLCLASCTSLD